MSFLKYSIVVNRNSKSMLTDISLSVCEVIYLTIFKFQNSFFLNTYWKYIL